MHEAKHLIEVSITTQTLKLSQDGATLFEAPVSTATNGPGFTVGSYQTPTGEFFIREKIGEGAPLNTTFKGRRPQGIWQGERKGTNQDSILTRILWLEGTDEENANTYQRYIYFHGTHAEELIGQPASHGCIRLKNEDMLQLFTMTPMFTKVTIQDQPL